MRERATQRSRSICHGCEKTRNNHGTFSTKVVKSVFVLLVMRGHDMLYSEWREKILCRSVHRVELMCVYCALKLLQYSKLAYCILHAR